MNKQRIKVVNLYDGFFWRLGKFIRRLPFYDQINSATIVKWFCKDAERKLSDMPHEIGIETINRCNGGCSFCPANAKDDERVKAWMSDELLEKIANELEDEKFSGTITLHINNEPLIDKRIARIAFMFRSTCPNAKILLSTNGTLLSGEKYVSLFDSGLDHMIINSYNESRSIPPEMNFMLENIQNIQSLGLDEYIKRTVVLLRNRNETLNSRGGDAPNKQGVERYTHYQKNSCTYPFHQMAILPDGRVSLCCEDYTGKITVGNVTTESIREVWNGQKLSRIRHELSRYGRSGMETCSKCDYGHLGGKKMKSLLKYFVGWFSKL